MTVGNRAGDPPVWLVTMGLPVGRTSGACSGVGQWIEPRGTASLQAPGPAELARRRPDRAMGRPSPKDCPAAASMDGSTAMKASASAAARPPL